MDPRSISGLGFVILNDADRIFCARCLAGCANSNLKAEAMTMLTALQECFKRNLNPDLILLDCGLLMEMLKSDDLMTARRLIEEITAIRFWLSRGPVANFGLILRDANKFTYRLAIYAHYNPEVSLFHKGFDLPR